MTYDLVSRVETTAFGTVTFTSLSSLDYRDLKLVFSSAITGGTSVAYQMTFNNDTSTSNYAQVEMYGNGSGTGSTTATAQGHFDFNITSFYTNGSGLITCDILDFKATDKHTPILIRLGYLGNSSYDGVVAGAGRYASTSAVDEIDVRVNSSVTVSLYGIAG